MSSPATSTLRPAAYVPGGGLFDLTKWQIERTLRERARYRYVQPRVLREADGFRIESPCCSRNIDPGGGMIDIAWLDRQPSGMWFLHARDHEAGRWALRHTGTDLADVLDALCRDPDRVFWP